MKNIYQTSIEILKTYVNKYVVFSYKTNPTKYDAKWIMLVKKIGNKKYNDNVYGTNIYGYYISEIIPHFKPYHLPSKQSKEQSLMFYANAQSSFRLATPTEIKTLREHWAKFRMESKKP